MTFRTFIESLVGAINTLVIPAIIALAFAYIVYGIVRFFFIEAGTDEGRRHGREFVLWGILGMVVMFSVWGLVYILLDTLGLAPA